MPVGVVGGRWITKNQIISNFNKHLCYFLIYFVHDRFVCCFNLYKTVFCLPIAGCTILTGGLMLFPLSSSTGGRFWSGAARKPAASCFGGFFLSGAVIRLPKSGPRGRTRSGGFKKSAKSIFGGFLLSGSSR